LTLFRMLIKIVYSAMIWLRLALVAALQASLESERTS
jgi:hypothetical protein